MDEPTPAPSAKITPDWERETLEKLVFATLREQRAARRWKIFFRLLMLAAVLLVIAMLMRDVATRATLTVPHTALIEVRGVIASDADANARAVVDSLRAAFEEPTAKGVLLLINSPGGSPVQAGIIADEIHRLRGLHDKPVHAVIEEVGASAAYYVASAATAIHVDKASLVGSIGVMMDGFGFTELMQKVGVERRLLTSGENKGFMDPFSPPNEAQVRHTQAMLDDIHQQFIDVVRKGRGERLRETPETFSGLIWNGQRAVEKGLADGFGSVEHVASEVIGAAHIIDYTQRENVAQQLARRLGAGAGESALQTLKEWGWVLR
ncbi:S49 family peptidase [Serpentinimonas barnesii]|uniref:S49 family peptidase n=1 Tax=Serpentinimonas barnesii TaxID=1458427 RepID=UPI000694885D|nr:S49 family peptidase [Serpentinimonas barnesii]